MPSSSSSTEKLPAPLPVLPLIVEQSLTGAILLDRYHVAAELGRGGMARVYIASDIRLRRSCVIKVAKGEQDTARLEREIDLTAELGAKVPGLLTVYDRGELPRVGMCFGVFELLDGQTLGERMRHPVPWEEALRIGYAVAGTLEAMHRNLAVHRDIKPDNLFLCRSGDVRVLDLGLAYSRGLEPLTARGEVLGTKPYMALEQVATPQKVDPRSDIYSLGLTVAQAIAGPRVLPQTKNMNPAAFEAVLRARPSLASLAPDVPEDVIAVIERACAVDRDARFETMAEFRDALVALLEQRREAERRAAIEQEKEQACCAVLEKAEQGHRAALEKAEHGHRAARQRLARSFAAGMAALAGLAFGAGYLAHREIAVACPPVGAHPTPTASPPAATVAVAQGAHTEAERNGKGASGGEPAASQTDPAATAAERGENNTDGLSVCEESPSQEKEMTNVCRAVIITMGAGAASVTPPHSTAYAKPPQMCQADSDCKKNEACKSAGSLGMWCAQYDPKTCAPSNYKFTKRSPDRLKGKCWILGTPDGSDPGGLY
jgi:hypothetical protein